MRAWGSGEGWDCGSRRHLQLQRCRELHLVRRVGPEPECRRELGRAQPIGHLPQPLHRVDLGAPQLGPRAEAVGEVLEYDAAHRLPAKLLDALLARGLLAQLALLRRVGHAAVELGHALRQRVALDAALAQLLL